MKLVTNQNSEEATLARSPFGWDLPPGCTHKQIEEAMGDDRPCECCGNDPADCVCPECPVCGSTGNGECYAEGGHDLRYNREQLIGQAKMRIEEMRYLIQEEEQYIEHLKDDGSFEQ
jgi:hypothetical protein